MGLRVILCSAVLLASLAGAATGAVGRDRSETRWTSPHAERVLAAATWRDHRIVIAETCVGTDARFQANHSETATRFACLLTLLRRPASVSAAKWDALGAAVRQHDVTRIYALLGLAADASATDVNAAERKWGFTNPLAVAVGLRALSATRWAATAPAIPADRFSAALGFRRLLLAAIPSVEAYYADHGTYAGMTLSKLHAIDRSVNAALKIATATKTRYCVQIGSPEWYERGPGAAPTLGHC